MRLFILILAILASLLFSEADAQEVTLQSKLVNAGIMSTDMVNNKCDVTLQGDKVMCDYGFNIKSGPYAGKKTYPILEMIHPVIQLDTESVRIYQFMQGEYIYHLTIFKDSNLNKGENFTVEAVYNPRNIEEDTPRHVNEHPEDYDTMNEH